MLCQGFIIFSECAPEFQRFVKNSDNPSPLESMKDAYRLQSVTVVDRDFVHPLKYLELHSNCISK